MIEWRRLIIWTLFLLFATLTGYFGGMYAASVRADAAPLSAPPCVPIAATGNIVISRCEDEETGAVLYVNNIGFIAVGD